MSRPHIQKGIAELEKLAADSSDNSEVIAELIAELEQRNTARARKLLETLRKGDGPDTPNERGTRARNRRSRPTAPRDVADDGISVVVEPPDSALRSVEEAYRILRETFTEESERLARWGMTSAMPISLRAVVFAEWKTTVGAEPDSFGRSLDQLSTDMDVLLGNHGTNGER